MKYTEDFRKKAEIERLRCKLTYDKTKVQNKKKEKPTGE
jgi:hypothetical protein